MKTLSHLQNEAIERFEKEFIKKTEHLSQKWYQLTPDTRLVFKEILKAELETIVKESFKNTRVEEKPTESSYRTADIRMIDSTQIGLEQNRGYNQAIKDTEGIQNQFLNN